MAEEEELPVESDTTPVESESVDESAPVESPEPQPVEPSAESQQGTVWDAFKTLPDFQEADDRQIAERLYQALQREQQAEQALQEYRQVMPMVREYLPHRDEFQKWRQAAYEQKPIQQEVVEPPEQPKWWNPPEVRDSYRQYLVRDEQGREVISEEAPLDAKHALYEYMKYKADFAQKFLADPEQALGPMVEQIAQQKAREIVQGQFKDYGEQQYVDSLEEQNRDWLYDEQGNPTPEGIAARQYIDEAVQLGITDVQKRWQYAAQRVELDLHNQIAQRRAAAEQQSRFASAMPPPAPQVEHVEETPAQNRAEKDIEYLRREARRTPSRSATAPDPRIPQAPKSFQDRLAAAAQRAGLA